MIWYTCTVNTKCGASMSDEERQELLRLREDNSRLTKLLEQVTAQLQDSLEGNTRLQEMITELQEKLDKVLDERKKRNRKDHGPTQERHNPRPALDATSSKNQHTKPRKKADHKKHIHSQNIPTEPVEYPVKPEDIVCPDCNVDTTFVDYKITYQLEKILQSIKRLEHKQEVRSCPKCKQHVITAEKPTPPIPGGLAGPNLLADTIVKKVEDGIPNNRQTKIHKRESATIPRSTLGDWFMASSFTIEPLYELLKKEVLASKVVQTDDCPVKIQNRKAKGRMRKGKMSAYRGDANHPLIFFDFSPDLSFQRNLLILEKFTGKVQADAATGFDALYRDGTKTEVGCHAHSRRKYFDLSDKVLTIYQKLYAVEKEIKGKKSEERLALRRRKSKPLVKKLRKAIVRLKDSLSPKNLLMEAVNYTLRHWIALTQFLKDPDLELDNNAIERVMKAFVLARKNFLFVGSDRAGKALAIHLSFVASCKRNNINPVEYLADVFSRINDMKITEIDQLLPHRWAKNKKLQEQQTSNSDTS